jgi:hypothetical protein
VSSSNNSLPLTPLNAAQRMTPIAPIASNLSASCTQCSSAHESCHGVQPPDARSLVSVLHDTLGTIRDIRSICEAEMAGPVLA